jgi:hypothetical protein
MSMKIGKSRIERRRIGMEMRRKVTHFPNLSLGIRISQPSNILILSNWKPPQFRNPPSQMINLSPQTLFTPL